jgi:hypothetical protein
VTVKVGIYEALPLMLKPFELGRLRHYDLLWVRHRTSVAFRKGISKPHFALAEMQHSAPIDYTPGLD